MKKKSLTVKGLHKYFLLGILLILAFLFFRFIFSFLGTLFVAAIVATPLNPIRKYLRHQTHFTRTISSFLLLIGVTVLVFLPLAFFFNSVVGQATGAYEMVHREVNRLLAAEPDTILPGLGNVPYVGDLAEKLGESNPLSAKNIVAMTRDLVGMISSSLLTYATNIIRNLTVFILHVMVFLLSLFYFIRDGEKIIRFIRSFLPLPEEQLDQLLTKIHDLMYSIIFGIFGAALAQGVFLGIGLTLAKVHNPLFWAALGALFSPLPYVGPGIVWVPIAVSLFLGQNVSAAIFLTLWGILVVSNVDNIVKPYLIGLRSMLHPLAMMLVILGGFFAFGFKGLILGPLVLTLFIAFLDIYKLEYAKVLPAPDPVVPKLKKEKKKK